MKNDIQTRGDVELLVNTFYDKVQKDEVLNHIFGTVAKTNWETHLPKMYAFWESILFNAGTFTGNPMQAHFRINNDEAFDPSSYGNWIVLWTETVNNLFEGPVANEAIFRATNIINITKYKLGSING